MQADPIGLAGGSLSLYSHVNNNPVSNIDPNGLQAGTLAPAAVPAIPSLTSACLTNPWICGPALAGAGGYALGTLINPYVQPYISEAIDSCMAAASDTPTQQECDAEWLRARNVCFEWMNELSRPGLSDRRRRELQRLTGGSMGICMSGQVSQACGGTKVEQPPKRRPKRYL